MEKRIEKWRNTKHQHTELSEQSGMVRVFISSKLGSTGRPSLGEVGRMVRQSRSSTDET